MTSTVRMRQEDAQQRTVTPTVGHGLRRGVFWVAAAIGLLLIAALLVVLGRGAEAGVPLAADNPGPAGAMALAEVLRQQGVDVVETESLDETTDAVNAVGGDATVLLADIDELLDDEQHRRLLLLVDELVVLGPTFLELEDFTPGIAQAGRTDGTFDTDCELTAAEKAGSVDAGGAAYRIVDAEDAEGCFADGDRYGLVQTERSGNLITLLGLTEALRNDEITEAGNAALALNLLGTRETLVWYVPGVADLSDQEPPSLAELTPPWVTPLAVMLGLVALAAVFWRSRRVGPLVVENLPVVVRASETMEGRARLYERGNARLHALDALRIGAVARLARSCGLPRTATVIEVVDAVAAVTGRDRASVAGILVDHAPATDAELVQLSDDLLRLEFETTQRSRPQRSRP